MKLIVCVNHVPDTTTKIAIGPDKTTIDRTGVTYILNPYDEFAVEECLALKEKNGGEVIAVSLGDDRHKETLRKALAMGVDTAVLLKDETVRDTYGVAAGLASYIKDQSPDMVLFGKQSIDSDDSAVGQMVAEILGMPCVSVAVGLTVEGSQVTVTREIEGGHETVGAQLPCVITAQKGLNEPRYPSLKGIMAAKKKTIEELPAPAADSLTTVVAMKRPPEKSAGKIVGTDASAVAELVRLLREEAKVI